ncbi:MAG TPA: N-acetylmuramoyl-L-alanine amidase [Chitinophagaceae bacterium]|nr:N-acetylmuramoyl-L-alanine amidase [Chitinophagaceae bacterium]
MKKFVLLFIIIFLSFSCNKYYSANRSYKKQARALTKIIRRVPVADSFTNASQWIGTTNFGLRRPNYVIIHHTAQNSCDQTLQTFTNKSSGVSAHYVICRDGTIHHMLNDYLRAWHAGVGSWGNNDDINSSSIGIELDNNGYDTFPGPQINSLLILLAALKNEYHIPTANFIGHEDIAPTRKNDPNKNFPWQLLAQNGFGLWYDDTTHSTVPENFNDIDALRIIGYSVKDSLAAIESFKRHFEMEDSSRILTDGDKKILYDLMKKYE